MQAPNLLHKSLRSCRHSLKCRLQNVDLVNARVIHDCCFERHLLARGTTAYGTKQQFSVTFADCLRISDAVLERGRGGSGNRQKNNESGCDDRTRKGAPPRLVDADDKVRG